MAKGDGGAWDIAAREKQEGTGFSFGTERKSALLCQLHDGPTIVASAFGGVEELGFACVRLAGPSVSARVAVRGGVGCVRRRATGQVAEKGDRGGVVPEGPLGAA